MVKEKVEFFSAEDVRSRLPLLKRVLNDVTATYEARRKKQERLEELVVISRKFSSCEIQETINNLRTQIAEAKRDLESLDREVRLLGGTLKDQRRGIVYFNSLKDNRPILLVWDPAQSDTVSWHEVDESFADRTPVQFPKGATAPAPD
ncbi:MAG: DUF2203 family protein [Planctomycetota bacterium]|nr:DUF2203 family protein [Planctomycetota bacterium]